MPEENISQNFRLKNTDETRNYLFEKINQNELITKKYKKACRVLNYIEHFLILISTVTGCVSVSPFLSLVGITIGITISAVGLKIYVITPRIKRHKSIIKKKKKKHYKIVRLAKPKLNSIEVSVSKALIDSCISHDKFVLKNYVLQECYDVKEEIKNSNNK